MRECNINEIMINALKAKRNNNIEYEKEIIKSFFQIINENLKLLEKTNQIDLKNNKGIEIDINIINKIFNKYLNENIFINNNKELNISKNNMLYSKVYEKIGILLILFDGNSYTLLELIILGILTHNIIIFKHDGFMFGTNGLLLTFIDSILEKNKYHQNMFQQIINIETNECFKNFKTIDKTIIIGDNNFITDNLKKCTTNVLISGYKNYDIYIEDNIDNKLINKIIATNEKINIYIKKDLQLEIDNAIYVNDYEEAISMINYNSCKYSSSIFTQNNEIASKFIKNVNSKYIMVNASPTLEQTLDIKQTDLLTEKTILIPSDV